MIVELTVVVEIAGDRVTRLGLKPCDQAPWFVTMVLTEAIRGIEREQLAQRLGAPQRYGALELPGNSGARPSL